MKKFNQKGFTIAEFGMIAGIIVICIIAGYLVLVKHTSPVKISTPSVEPLYSGVIPSLNAGQGGTANQKTDKNKK